MRNPARAEALREAVARHHFDPDDRRSLQVLRLDVDDAEATAEFSERMLVEHGAVDVLVNNAGIMAEGFAEEFDEAELRRLFETNFFAATRLTRAFVPAMRERRRGWVINVSSIGGRFAVPSHAGYHASKFALEGWSEALRYELRPFNVFVTLVEPGVFDTEIFGTSLRRVGDGANGRGPYARLAQQLRTASDRVRRRWAGVPSEVGERIASIAVTPKPRLRYPVGLDAWASHAAGSGMVTRLWERTVSQWSKG